MPAGRNNPLVTPEWLETRLGDPAVRVIEVSSEESPATFDAGHIPGAVWFYWKDLCWDDSDRQFLTPAQLADRLGKVGIDESSTVVLSGDPVQYGTYAYFALLMAGHHKLRLLDGARTRWLAEGRPLGVRRGRRSGGRIAGRHRLESGLASPLTNPLPAEHAVLDDRSTRNRRLDHEPPAVDGQRLPREIGRGI